MVAWMRLKLTWTGLRTSHGMKTATRLTPDWRGSRAAGRAATKVPRPCSRRRIPSRTRSFMARVTVEKDRP